MTFEQVTGDIRRHYVVSCRWELMQRLDRELGWSGAKIARFLNKDHTTVIHGLRQTAERIEAMRQNTPDKAAERDKLRKRVRAYERKNWK